MILNTEVYLQEITIYLSILKNNISIKNSLKRFDINISSEGFLCDLLNLIFNYNLSNLNLVEENAEAIDLIDEKNGIVIQVTATTDKKKIKDTITKFENKYNSSDTFKRLIIFLLKDKKKYRSKFETKKIQFDPKEDIWDFNYIAKEIDKKDLNERLKILEFLKQHIALNISPVSDKLNVFFVNIINKLKSVFYADLLSPKPSITIEHFQNLLALNNFLKEFIFSDNEKFYKKYVDNFSCILSKLISIINNEFKYLVFSKEEILIICENFENYNEYDLIKKFIFHLTIELYAAENLLKSIIINFTKIEGNFRLFDARICGLLYPLDTRIEYKEELMQTVDSFSKFFDINHLTKNDLSSYQEFLTEYLNVPLYTW